MRYFGRTCRSFLETISKEKTKLQCKETTGMAMCYIEVAYEYGLFGYPLNHYTQ